MNPREFSPADAKRFYDRFGAKQDSQIYERRPVERLVALADFQQAMSVFEFGCGTGSFARRLLRDLLPPGARYAGVDISTTMAQLAQEKIAPWRERATVRLTDGSTRLAESDGACDRFVTAYVLDLLKESSSQELLRDAHRILAPGGLLCVVTLSEGRGPISRAISAAWKGVHALNPSLVGGCRPIRVASLLDPHDWRIEHTELVPAWGICSEVLIARRI